MYDFLLYFEFVSKGSAEELPAPISVTLSLSSVLRVTK